jgi:hypothetical protein
MSGMRQDVQRWQQPDRPGVPSDRWTGWAQSLRERHGHILLRHHGVAMTLAMPSALFYVCCQRWENAAWTLSPQINLAISPILQQTVWHRASVLLAAQASSVPLRPPLPISARVPAQQPAERQWVGADLPEAALPAGKPMFALAELDPGWHMPLQRVFRRANVEDVYETVTVSRVHHARLVAQQSLQIWRRVVEERQRVEGWERRTIMTRQQKEVTSVVTAAEAREVMMHSPHGPKVGGSGMTQTVSPPPLTSSS